MSKDIDKVKELLSQREKETESFLNQALSGAEKASGSKSEVIYGSIGFTIGALIATILLAVGVPFAGAFFPILMVLGTLLGIVWYRSPKRIRAESLMELEQDETQRILDTLERLPENTPQEIIDGYWKRLAEIANLTVPKSFEHQAKIDNGNTPELEPVPLLITKDSICEEDTTMDTTTIRQHASNE